MIHPIYTNKFIIQGFFKFYYFNHRFFHTTILRPAGYKIRSEEHTSELQSHSDLVCRLLLEKKKKKQRTEILNEQTGSDEAARPYPNETVGISRRYGESDLTRNYIEILDV